MRISHEWTFVKSFRKYARIFRQMIKKQTLPDKDPMLSNLNSTFQIFGVRSKARGLGTGNNHSKVLFKTFKRLSFLYNL